MCLHHHHPIRSRRSCLRRLSPPDEQTASAPAHDFVLRKTGVVSSGTKRRQGAGRCELPAGESLPALTFGARRAKDRPPWARRGPVAEEIYDAGGCSSFAGPC
jgi:hypothetical protein